MLGYISVLFCFAFFLVRTLNTGLKIEKKSSLRLDTFDLLIMYAPMLVRVPAGHILYYHDKLLSYS